MSISASRERSLANLRPWKAGQTGNPGGRPKAADDIVEMLSPHVPTAVAAIERGLNDPKNYLRAAEILFDRVYGKPVQAIEATGDNMTVLHLFAARLAEQLEHPVIDANATDVVATETTPPPDIYEPAKE